MEEVSSIFHTFVGLLTSGRLAANVGATLWRVFLGLGIGGMSGLILGMFMGWSPSLHFVVDPFIAAAHPVPKVAVLPLLMIFFGIGESPKVIVLTTYPSDWEEAAARRAGAAAYVLKDLDAQELLQHILAAPG